MQSEDNNIGVVTAVAAVDGQAQTGAVTPAETIDQWLEIERLSKSSFYELDRRGLAPYGYVVPDSKIRRITESHESWRARMVALAATEAAKLETSRRRELAKAAGKHAAKSRRARSRHG